MQELVIKRIRSGMVAIRSHTLLLSSCVPAAAATNSCSEFGGEKDSLVAKLTSIEHQIEKFMQG